MLFVQIFVINSQDIREKVPLGPHGAQVAVVFPKDTEPFPAKTNANNGQGRGKQHFVLYSVIIRTATGKLHITQCTRI